MQIKELLEQFPKKSFSQEFEEKMISIKGLNSNINDEQINQFKTEIQKIFDFDNLIFIELYTLLKNFSEKSISQRDRDIIFSYGLNRIGVILGHLNRGIDTSKNNIYRILENFKIQVDREFLLHNPIKTRADDIQTGDLIIDTFIDKIEQLISDIRSRFSIQEEIEKGLTLINEIQKKGKAALEIATSLLKADTKNTQSEINELGEHFLKEANKNIKNTKWLIFSICCGLIIIGTSMYDAYCLSGDELTYSHLAAKSPIIIILTIFLVFFLKIFNKKEDLFTSYRFKYVSANFMESLLDFKLGGEESKVILEKVLDKILEDPTKNQKMK